MVAAIIGAVAEILEDFRFEKEIDTDEPGDTTGDRALMFKASVSDPEIQSCDFLHTRQDGLTDGITVMLRPLSTVTVFAERTSEEFRKAMARNGVAADMGHRTRPATRRR
jgi:hypothetical protein